MKGMIKSFFEKFGVHVGSVKQQIRQTEMIREIDALFEFSLATNGGGDSRAQLKQDIFALMANGFKRGGYFVEFGATNGMDLSNTFLLEKSYGWNGILAEPASIWHSELKGNRNCNIETDCIWSETGAILDFDMVDIGEFSTISDFAKCDGHSKKRENKRTCKVETISLIDLLQKYKAPKIVDYMSVDTEGSEYEILSAFDFSAYRFNVITVEHNFAENRERLRELLEKNGYSRVFQYASKFDDWYVAERSQ